MLLSDVQNKPLGRWGNCKYKSKDDFIISSDYLEYMYGDTNGFIARVVLPRDGNIIQELFRRNQLIYENEYDGLPEVYTSMNSFVPGYLRTIENLLRLNTLFIDIDYYKLNLTHEQVIHTLETEYFDKVIPRPTFIINSGRGLYLQWKIYKGEDKLALPKWNKIQKYFRSKLKDLGADQQAIDAARILRVPGTGNSSSKSLVRVEAFSDVQYTLYEIIEKYNIHGGQNFDCRWGEATPRQKECAAKIAEERGIQLPNFADYDETREFIGKFVCNGSKNHILNKFSGATDNQIKYATKIAENKGLVLPDFNDYKATWDFIAANRNKPFSGVSYLDYWRQDIETLITLRRGENCCRELCLFLYRLWFCETINSANLQDYERALQATLELNSKLDVPFTESYVRTHTQSAEAIIKHGETYRYKKNSIIGLLEITPDEMKQLDYLTYIPANERRQAKDKKKYEKYLEETDKKTKQETIQLRRTKIAEMINAGKPKEEIRNELNISQSTYYTDRAALEAQGLIARAEKIINTVKDRTKIAYTNIVNLIKEAAENLKELLSSEIKSDTNKTIPNLLYDLSKNGIKKPKNEADTEVSKKFPSTIVYGRSPP